MVIWLLILSVWVASALGFWVEAALYWSRQF